MADLYLPQIGQSTQGDFLSGLQNKFTGNLDYARELESMNKSNAFNSKEASIQRQWEEEMSNTAYQRQAADLEAAGYNPALVLGAGGASTPSAAAARSSGSTPRSSGSGFDFLAKLIGTIVTVNATSAIKSKALEQQLELNNAKIDALAARSELNSALATKSQSDIILNNAKVENLSTRSKLNNALSDKAKNDITKDKLMIFSEKAKNEAQAYYNVQHGKRLQQINDAYHRNDILGRMFYDGKKWRVPMK